MEERKLEGGLSAVGNDEGSRWLGEVSWATWSATGGGGDPVRMSKTPKASRRVCHLVWNSK